MHRHRTGTQETLLACLIGMGKLRLGVGISIVASTGFRRMDAVEITPSPNDPQIDEKFNGFKINHENFAPRWPDTLNTYRSCDRGDHISSDPIKLNMGSTTTTPSCVQPQLRARPSRI
ncbi:hypothetical protein B0H13DRAFT_1859433 [Mycena leptocephala]|nr:hypothetical protein B0H13DRAFT_1859433 [Mycena leptocephala]